MRIQFGFCLAFALLFSIGYETSGGQLCRGINPDRELTWLKIKSRTIESSPCCNNIARTTYNNPTVFIRTNGPLSVASVPFMFAWDGNQLDLKLGEFQNLKFTGPLEGSGELIDLNHFTS